MMTHIFNSYIFSDTDVHLLHFYESSVIKTSGKRKYGNRNSGFHHGQNLRVYYTKCIVPSALIMVYRMGRKLF